MGDGKDDDRRNRITSKIQYWNIQIKEMCKQRKGLSQAFRIFEDIQKQGVIPDVITFNTLILACAKNNKVDGARKLFKMMRGQGLVPNVKTYEALIAACTKGGELTYALELYAGMEQEGV